MTQQEANMLLQEELLKLDDKINEYQDMLYKAKKYIEENSTKFGKYRIIIDENDELSYILTEKVQI